MTINLIIIILFFKPNHAKNLGVPGYESALLIGYLSIASTVSRVLFGLVLNHPRINRFYVLQVCVEIPTWAQRFFLIILSP